MDSNNNAKIRGGDMNQVSTPVDPDVSAFEQGELLIYATEAVMGIGCDPNNEAAVKNCSPLSNAR